MHLRRPVWCDCAETGPRKPTTPVLRTSTRIHAVLAAIVCALVWAAPAAAQDPNDSFDGRFLLQYGITDNLGDNATAGTQGGEVTAGCDGATVGKTLWWEIVGSGRPTTVTTEGSTPDTTLGLFNGSPSARLACNDDEPGGDTFSRLTFTPARGQRLQLQVGSFNNGPGGPIEVTASTEPPGNDARGAAAGLPTNELVENDNMGATTEPGENTTCVQDGASISYGNTVWYRWSSPGQGTVAFSASGYDTVLAVYRADGSFVACNDDISGTNFNSRVSIDVGGGDYLVQVGGYSNAFDNQGLLSLRADHTPDPDRDRDGSPNSQDCAPDDPRRRPGIADVPANGIDEDCDGRDAERADRDGDGVLNSMDCAPDNPAIRPGARDIPGNRIDEDCSGRDAAFPVLRARVSANWLFFRRHTRISRMRVVNLLAGSLIDVRCSGRGCPYRRRAIRVRRATSSLNIRDRRMRRARLRRGARITVRITRAGHVGRVTTLHFRRFRRDPQQTNRCLPPGATRSVSCRGLG